MRPLAVALVALLLSGCGSAGGSRASEGERAHEWASGAAQLLTGLDEALTRVADAGVGAFTLENTSALYEALLGYTYLDDCSRLLTQLGEPAPRQAVLGHVLQKACTHLVHASNVFTRAVRLDRPALLVVAAREALGAASLLRRAHELLRSAS